MYPIAISAKRSPRVNTVTDLSAVVFVLASVSHRLTPMGTDWLQTGVSG